MKKLEVISYMGNFEITFKHGNYNLNLLVFKNINTEKTFEIQSYNPYSLINVECLYNQHEHSIGKNYRFPTLEELEIIFSCRKDLIEWVKKNHIGFNLYTVGDKSLYFLPQKVSHTFQNPYDRSDSIIDAKYLVYDMGDGKVKMIDKDVDVNYFNIFL